MRRLHCAKSVFDLDQRPIIMGIVNVTPDSFSDGGRYHTVKNAVAQALSLLENGADVVDIGGESTRPGASAVTEEEEWCRVLPVVDALLARGEERISIDTRHASTALLCRARGVPWLNDISALEDDPAMAEVATHFDVVILMHKRGSPKTMQERTRYDDVVAEVGGYLAARVRGSGLDPTRVIVDPGIGFGKDTSANIELTRALRWLRGDCQGVLYGPSRKRFLGDISKVAEASNRDPATHAAVALAVGFGADVLRVHDASGARQALEVALAFAQ